MEQCGGGLSTNEIKEVEAYYEKNVTLMMIN